MFRRWLAQLLTQQNPEPPPPSPAALDERLEILQRAFKRLEGEWDKTLEEIRAERARVRKALHDRENRPAPAAQEALETTIVDPEGVHPPNGARDDLWARAARLKKSRAATGVYVAGGG